MRILSTTLSSLLQKTLQLNNVYHNTPHYKNLPYATLRNTKNKYWETLLSSGIESSFRCELHTREINMQKMSLMINNVKIALKNQQILEEQPNIIDIQIESYKVKVENSILSGIIDITILQTGFI